MNWKHTISRRQLLAAGGGVAAMMGGPLTAGPAAASVPASRRFDLSKPSHDLFRHRRLFRNTVMQSFAYDNHNRRLFVAQVTNDARGDLCITQLDFAGNQHGHMLLNGFGHGVSIGVEPSGSASILWLETGPVTHVGPSDQPSARGTQLGRVLFTDGLELDWTNPRVERHMPIPGTDIITCATDPINHRLVMRYRRNGVMRYATYNIADVRAGRYRRLADIAQPTQLKGKTFQGFTVFGDFLYMLDGTAYDTHKTHKQYNPPPGNAHISSVNLNTGRSFIRAFTKAGGTLTYREPEGMAIYRTRAGETRLFLGFASGKSGDRRANIFYKNLESPR